MKSEVDECTHDSKESNLDTTLHDPMHNHTQLESSLGSNGSTVFPKKRRLFWIFIVNEGINYPNLISYLIACFATICLVAYLAIVQPFVLTVLLGISENTGDITGSLALYDEALALPATLLWGILSDRIGRRPVYSVGFVFVGVAMILYSYVKNVYPHMLLCRLLFSFGCAACTCMMTGTLGDVAGGQHERGRVSAAVGMFTGFGGLVAGMVLIKVPYQLGTMVNNDAEGIQLALTIVGGCAIGMAFIFAFTMPNLHSPPRGGVWTRLKRRVMPKTKGSIEAEVEQQHAVAHVSREILRPFKLLKYGILAARDPRIALAYFSSFVARADTVLFSSFVSLWVIQHYLDLGWCRNGVTCGPAAGDTHMLTGMGQGISLAFAPFFGFAGEKFKKSSVLAIGGLIGAIGCFPFAFTKVAPAHKSNYVFVCMIGIGQIGMIVTGMTLVNGTYINPKYRGSVAGVFSFCGAVSIMIMAKLGGYLFDVWMRGAPFVLLGIAHLLVVVFSIYVRIITPRLERQDKEMFAKEKAARDGTTEMEVQKI